MTDQRPRSHCPIPQIGPDPDANSMAAVRALLSNRMTQSNRLNRIRYGLYAPIYDWLARPWEGGRRRAIERLNPQPGDRILILGCGTGRDLAYLPTGVKVVAIDVTEPMVRRTAARAKRLGVDTDARIGDAQCLPFEAGSFDAVLLHLVLSVVAAPGQLVEETARVLRADGRVSIYDKFVPAGKPPSGLRRAVNPLARLFFADLTRRLEPMLSGTDLQLEEREPFLGGLYTVTTAHGQPESEPDRLSHPR